MFDLSAELKTTGHSVLCQPGRDIAAIWALRILIDLGGWKGLDGNRFLVSCDDPLLSLVGLNRLEDVEVERKEFLRLLKQRRKKIERIPTLDADLADNIERLGDLVGLSQMEKSIFSFVVLLEINRGLAQAADALGVLTRGALFNALSVVLKIPESQVQTALSAKGLLIRAGLVRSNKGLPREDMTALLEPLDGLASALTVPHADPMALLSRYFHLSKQATLTKTDFRHLGNRYSVIQKYLSKATRKNTVGVNILFYGSPGTGKTELARATAVALDIKLYEVACADEDGDPMRGTDRFAAYKLCQQILSRQPNGLVLFDEIEDVFQEITSPVFGRSRAGEKHKAWVNRMLEDNRVPTIWITNDITQLDAAFVRRFDLVLELDHPPRKTRARILRQHLQGIPVSDRWIERTAENPNIAPAVIARAARVVEMVGKKTAKTAESTLDDVVASTLTAMGYPRKSRHSRQEPLVYRLDALNPSTDLKRIVAGLQRRPLGKICLYGPSGTGKSEFGYFLSKQLDRPLLLKRASDLLSPYVGETEHHIAEMFEHADADDAVLLLDEADSFLRNRMMARQSWEVTQVNELLTQMETFNGLFLCSTNLVETLDTASLRRFDLKIHFGFLKSEQAWTLFREIVDIKSASKTEVAHLRVQLARLDELSPGDFATVVRRSDLLGGSLSAEQLLSELSEEVQMKRSGQSRGIGFTAAL